MRTDSEIRRMMALAEGTSKLAMDAEGTPFYDLDAEESDALNMADGVFRALRWVLGEEGPENLQQSVFDVLQNIEPRSGG